LGSVALGHLDAGDMPDVLLTAIVFLMSVASGAILCAFLARTMLGPGAEPRSALRPTGIGIGTVRAVDGLVTLDVECVSGQHFVGKLGQAVDEAPLDGMHPGVLLLVTFDPSERERLSLADDMAAVRTAFDAMLVRKGLVTPSHLDLIRNGTRSRGIVTAMSTTGATREEYREVELDLMVRRTGGGQFPAHETALVPESALVKVSPGSVVDAYYRRGDESTVAVAVPPR
jgi:hypothetical protein